MLAILTGAQAGAQKCPEVRGFDGFGPLNQKPHAVTVDGTLAYTADEFGMSIYDVSDPTNPVLLGDVWDRNPPCGYSVWPSHHQVSVSAGIALVVNGCSTMTIVDVADPANPVVLGRYETPGKVGDVVRSGSLAYLTAGDALHIVDLSDPTNPVSLGTLDAGDDVSRLALEGTLAVVGGGYYDGFLWLVDVTDPANPTTLAFVETGWVNIHDVVVSGGMAYVAAGGDGLHVVDVSDPTLPRFLGSFATPEEARGIALDGGGSVLYLADDVGGLQVYDVSDPTLPRLIGIESDSDVAGDVAVVADLAWLADEAFGLRSYDVTEPTVPTLLGGVDTRGEAVDVAVAGSVAYVADGEKGLQVVDVSNPESPVLLGGLDTPGFAGGVAVEGNLVLVADGDAGLQLIDVSDPTSPVLLGNLTTPGTAHKVVVAGGLAYVADGPEGLQIVDVTDPGNPVIVGHYLEDFMYSVELVSISGDVAWIVRPYSAGYEMRIWVLDISDPTNPILLGGGWFRESIPSDIVASGDLAFLVGRYSGSMVVQLQESGRISRVGRLPSGYALELAGNVMWITTDTSLKVVDVTLPEHLLFLGEAPIRGPGRGLALDHLTGALWSAEGSILEGIHGACGSCAGLSLIAEPGIVTIGGQASTITVTVTDPLGDPAPGLAVTGSTDLGTLSAFSDNGDGTYTAILTSGAETGVATVRMEVDGITCHPTAQVQIICDVIPDPPAGVQASVEGEGALRVTWNPTPDAAAYRVYRGGALVAHVAPDVTTVVETGLSPGREHCYTVVAVDPCGDEGLPDGEACAITPGETLLCAAVVGFQETPYGTVGSAVSGDVAFLAHRDDPIEVVDVSDPTAPRTLATLETTYQPTRLVFSGDHLYLARSQGFTIVDVSDPTRPVEVGHLLVPEGVDRIAIWGSTAYLLNPLGLKIVDVSDPSNPIPLGGLPLPSSDSRKLAAGEDHVLAVVDGIPHVVDVSDPTNPFIAGTLDLEGVYQVALSGNLAFMVQHLLRGDLLHVVSLADPTDPTILGSTSLSNALAPEEPDLTAESLTVSGTTVYLNGTRVTAVDVADPSHPAVMGVVKYSSPLGANRTMVSGGNLYMETEKAFLIARFGPSGPPVADFGWMDGLYSYTLWFIDQAAHCPETWSWDFGDGATSDSVNPLHEYWWPGIYTVTLTVTNGYGSDTVSRQVMVSEQVFEDVPPGSFGFHRINLLAWEGVTSGCSADPPLYCPSGVTLRNQMAKFLLRSSDGPAYLPPDPVGLFDDVPVTDPFAGWIEELANRGITAGCSADPPLYCPTGEVTRSQMAKFLLRALEGPAYVPPDPVGLFDDVPVTDPFARWIEELASRGITAGCSADPPLFCPGATVTRAQMAVFLGKAFGLGVR